MTPRQRRLVRRPLGAIAGLALVLPILGGPAAADPVDQKKAEAARLQRQLEAEGTRASVSAERYNQAQIRFDKVRSQVAKAQENMARADQRMQAVKGRLSQVAIVAYVHGGSNSVLSHLVRSDHDDFVVRRQYLRLTAADQRRVLGELREAREELTDVRGRLAAEERAAQAAAGAAAAAKRSAADAEAAQRVALGRVNGELAGLVAAEEARREAEAGSPPPPSPRPPSAKAAAPGGTPAPKAAAAPPAPPPPVGRGAAAAVAEAKRQIGKPYVYGGSGPDSFDCSGLTAWAWRAGGVSLSHSALAQYHETTRVPPDQVQPGDLLFFGPSVSGIHHNAIYVGGGQMVEASQTGTPVRYRGWRAKDLVGVGRPG